MSSSRDLMCWCGNRVLLPFSPDYCICTQCQTLVCLQPVDDNVSSGLDDQSLYGKSYWFEHQEEDLKFGNILSRARTDIPERILYWLRTLQKYKIPPGQTLELGCSHGGFVYTLQMTGFNSTGLELSPWVVNFAQQTFQVPILLGDIEQQSIAPATLDAIIMMDVLEHLPDPVKTISYAVNLLKADGILLIQTPRYTGEKSYEELKSTNDPFLMQFKAPEHIYLFSSVSVQQLLETCGLPNIAFEPAFFNQYDMFVVASPSPLSVHTQEEIEQSLLASPGGRLGLALLDKDSECNILDERLRESEADRAARLNQIQQYSQWLEEFKTERASQIDQIRQYKIWLEESEAERAARWDQIQQYKIWLEESEADRAARFEVIKNQEQVISMLKTDLSKLRSSFIFKLLKRFGLWK